MIKRTIQKSIWPWVKREEILFLSGPRQVGKTTLLKAFQKELSSKGEKTVYFNLENPNDLALAENYDKFLAAVTSRKGKTVVFLDEIQLHSRPSNLLKWLYDEHRSRIKLFVSGSANLEIKAQLQDSLAGRKKTFRLTPFTFSEFLEAKKVQKNQNPLTGEKQLQLFLEEYLLYGGLPQVTLEPDLTIKRALLEEYVGTYISKDIRYLIAENHVLTFNNLLIFLAKIMGNLKNNAEIAKELAMNHLTLKRYLDLLQNTFVVDFLPPYFSNEISRVRKASKVYFFDNGVRNSLLSNFAPMDKRTDTGALFENAVYLHLKQHYSKRHLFFLRTVSGNEIDFIGETDEGERIGFEVKYSHFNQSKIPRSLLELLKKGGFKKIVLVNKNLNQSSLNVDFVSFEKLSALGG